MIFKLDLPISSGIFPIYPFPPSSITSTYKEHFPKGSGTKSRPFSRTKNKQGKCPGWEIPWLIFPQHRDVDIVLSENPRAHNNKIGTSPPLPQTQNTPPLKPRILWTWRFSCRKNAEILGAHKIGAAISGPRIADKNFTDTRIFLMLANR